MNLNTLKFLLLFSLLLYPFLTFSSESKEQKNIEKLSQQSEISSKVLISLLSDRNLENRIMAWNRLVKMGRSVVDDLIYVIETPNHPSRAMAIGILGEIGDPKALDNLFDLLSENNPQIRVWTVRAIGKIKDERGIPYLIKALDDKDRLVRTSASYYLSKFGKVASESLIQEMEKGNETTKFLAHKALVEMIKKDSYSSTKSGKKSFTKKIEDDGVFNLITKLGDPNPVVSSKAEVELKNLGSSALKPILKSLPQINDEKRRNILTQVIKEINQSRGVKSLDNVSPYDLIVIGIAKSGMEERAIVEDLNGTSYLLKEGSIVGRFQGVVTEIKDGCILINEYKWGSKNKKLCVVNRVETGKVVPKSVYTPSPEKSPSAKSKDLSQDTITIKNTK